MIIASLSLLVATLTVAEAEETSVTNAAPALESALAAEEARIDTRVFRLRHVAASDVADNLNAMWNGDFGQTWKVTKMAIAFPESNSIVVTAPRVILDACEKAVAELDIEQQQVYVEARAGGERGRAHLLESEDHRLIRQEGDR